MIKSFLAAFGSHFQPKDMENWETPHFFNRKMEKVGNPHFFNRKTGKSGKMQEIIFERKQDVEAFVKLVVEDGIVDVCVRILSLSPFQSLVGSPPKLLTLSSLLCVIWNCCDATSHMGRAVINKQLHTVFIQTCLLLAAACICRSRKNILGVRGVINKQLHTVSNIH